MIKILLTSLLFSACSSYYQPVSESTLPWKSFRSPGEIYVVNSLQPEIQQFFNSTSFAFWSRPDHHPRGQLAFYSFKPQKCITQPPFKNWILHTDNEEGHQIEMGTATYENCMLHIQIKSQYLNLPSIFSVQ